MRPSWDTVVRVQPQHAGHETHRHPDRRGRYSRAERHDSRRGRPRQPAAHRDLRADQGVQQPLQSARAAPAPEPAVPGDSRARPDQGRHADRVVAGLHRPAIKARARPDHRPAEEARHRGADCRRRRRHAQRPAAAGRTPADGARAEDHRQRPGTELPERSRTNGRASRTPTARPATATRARRRTPSSISIRSSTTRRPAMRRQSWSPHRASSASAPRPRAIAGSRSSR